MVFYSIKNLQDSAEFAMASSALKHTVYGDINPFSREEIESFYKKQRKCQSLIKFTIFLQNLCKEFTLL